MTLFDQLLTDIKSALRVIAADVKKIETQLGSSGSEVRPVYKGVSSFSALQTLLTPSVPTLVQVDIDSDKKLTNTLYWLLPGGQRRYVPTTDDKFFDLTLVGDMFSDGGGAYANGSWTYDKVFDGDPATYYYASTGGDVIVGRDFRVGKSVSRFVLLAQNEAEFATALNGAKVQYSSDSYSYTTAFTVSGITTSNYTQKIICDFTPVEARYWRLLWSNRGHLAELSIYRTRS